MKESRSNNFETNSDSSAERFEQMLATFAVRVNGKFRAEDGLDERDVAGAQSEFTKWFENGIWAPGLHLFGKTLSIRSAGVQQLLGEHYRSVYIHCECGQFKTEIRTCLKKKQTYDRAKIVVTCPIEVKGNFKFEVSKKPKSFVHLPLTKPLLLPKWLSFFVPNLYMKSRGTSVAPMFSIPIKNESDQIQFSESCTDQQIGERFAAHPGFQNSLQKVASVEILEIGYPNWLSKMSGQLVELQFWTDSKNMYTMDAAWELMAICLALLSESNIVVCD